MKLIDKDELLQTIEQLPDRFDALDFAHDILTAIQSAPEKRDVWISVTKKLPEPDSNTKYLVCCRTTKGLRSINIAWFDGSFWYSMGSMAVVTHWVPLPELPEGE
jgi:hypothetical protein